MVTLTVFLNTSEWDRVRYAAQTWLGEKLSSTELGRRLMVLGCSALENMARDQQVKAGETFRSEMDTTPDHPARLQGQDNNFSAEAGEPAER